MHVKILLSILIINGFFGFHVQGQDFVEEFDSFKNSQKEEYNTFVEQIDKDFADFLRQNWVLFDATSEKKKEAKPKPEQFPKATSTTQKGLELKVDSLQGKKITLSRGLVMPVNYKTSSFQDKPLTARFEFYGQEINIRYEAELNIDSLEIVNPESIAEFWINVSATDYMLTLNDLFIYHEQLGLNDYGFYLLIKTFTHQVTASQPMSNLLTWYLLSKSKYKSRIGYNEDQVYLMLPSENKVYGTSYFTDKGETYYVLDYNGGEILSYKGDYPKSYKTFDFAISRSLNFSPDLKTRTLSFKYKETDYQFNFTYNKNAIDFYQSIPSLGLTSYFNSLVTTQTQQSIITNLRPVIESMSEFEAISFLLNLVQNGFGYKIDQDQFGTEKAFFPEEILFYPFSDCEDRSVFLAYLISTLLGNDVIGLDYPSHVAVGVLFNEDIPGDYYMFHDKKYVVCDPTYINAPIGVSMKDLTATPAQIINANTSQYSLPAIQSLKKVLGINGPTSSPRFIEVETGKVMAASYATDIFIQNTVLEPVNNSTFVASFDNSNELRWMIKDIQKGGNGKLIDLQSDANANTYILYAITDDQGIHHRVNKIDASGRLTWSKNIPVVSSVYENANTQAILYNENGERIAGKTYTESSNYKNSKMNLYDNKILVILPVDQ